MPVAGVDEQFGELGADCCDEFASRVDVALQPEERVFVHAMDLDCYAARPRAECPIPSDGDARLVEQRTPRAGPRLREPLRLRGAPREARVNEVFREAGDDLSCTI